MLEKAVRKIDRLILTKTAYYVFTAIAVVGLILRCYGFRRYGLCLNFFGVFGAGLYSLRLFALSENVLFYIMLFVTVLFDGLG